MAKKKTSKRSLMRRSGKSQSVVAAGLAAVVADQVLADGAGVRSLLGQPIDAGTALNASQLAAIEPVALPESLDSSAPEVRDIAAAEPEAVAEELLAIPADGVAPEQDVLVAQADVAAPAESGAEVAAQAAAATEGEAKAAAILTGGEGAAASAAAALAAVPPAAIVAGVAAVGLAVTSSGGDGGSAPTEAPTVDKKITVLDGPLQGAKVYYDTNKDGIADESEYLGKTDANGALSFKYTPIAGAKFLIVHDATDADGDGTTTDTLTGNLFSLDLAGMDNGQAEQVISPFSTLIAQGVPAATLAAALGLPANTNFDQLNFFDVIKKGTAGGATPEELAAAQKMAAAAIALANVVETAVKAAQAAGSTLSAEQLASTAFQNAAKVFEKVGSGASLEDLTKLATQVAVAGALGANVDGLLSAAEQAGGLTVANVQTAVQADPAVAAKAALITSLATQVGDTSANLADTFANLDGADALDAISGQGGVLDQAEDAINNVINGSQGVFLIKDSGIATEGADAVLKGNFLSNDFGLGSSAAVIKINGVEVPANVPGQPVVGVGHSYTISTADWNTPETTVSATTIADALGIVGLPSAQISGFNATAGSAIVQTVTVAAGDTLTFHYKFGSFDYVPWNDLAFFAVKKVDGTSAQDGVQNLFDVDNLKGQGYYTDAGVWKISNEGVFTFTFNEAGTYKFGIGATDVGDTIFDTVFTVDNLRINGQLLSEAATELGNVASSVTGGETYAPVDSISALLLTGKYGQLIVTQSGDYIYQQGGGNADNILNGQFGYEEFSYTVKTAIGEATQKLTIKVVGTEHGDVLPTEPPTEVPTEEPTTSPETTAPETTAPETTAPETTAPETTAPETTAPETTAPDTTAPDTTAPDTTAPDTTAPDTTAPDTTAPDTTAPDTTAPETTAPDTTAPDTTAPDTTAPETTAPEPTEQPIKINNSLVGIAGLETNPVQGDPGTSFLIEGGVGDIGPDSIDSLGLQFAQDLDVTLQVLADDAGLDAVVDGTIQLNTSLAGLAGLGIDQITGAAGLNVAVTGGVGDQTTLGGLGGMPPHFDQGLNVTQHLVAGDALVDGVAGVDGTIHLNTSLAGIAGLGIDAVTGADGQHVVVMGGIGATSPADLPNLTKFAAGLNVTQHVTQADLVALGGFAGGVAPMLADHGIDTLSVGAANLDLGDVSALLEAGLNFAASDDISFVDADVTGTVLADHHITLDDLANLGIDSVDVNVGEMDTIGIDAKDGLTADNLAEELTKLVEKFQGQVFAAQDEVTLHVGDNAVAGLSDALLNEIELLGIDFLSGNDLGGPLDLTKV